MHIYYALINAYYVLKFINIIFILFYKDITAVKKAGEMLTKCCYTLFRFATHVCAVRAYIYLLSFRSVLNENDV